MSISYQQIARYVNQSQFSEAVVVAGEFLQNNPSHVNAHILLGWSLYKTGELALARSSFDQYSSHLIQLDLLKIVQGYYWQCHELEELIRICQRTLVLFPECAASYKKLGLAHYHSGDNPSATEAYRKAYNLTPTPLLAVNLGLSLLRDGEYREGLDLYEQRGEAYPTLQWLPNANFPINQWKGELLAGKAILLWGEQGLGDTIQFSRYISSLAVLGAQVDFVFHKPHTSLQQMISTVPGIRDVILIENGQFSAKSRHDFHCSLMSLPHHLGVNPYFNFAPIPYLRTTQSLPLATQVLQRLVGLKVGVVWFSHIPQGNMNQSLGKFKLSKNVPFEQFNVLFEIPNIHFVSLQIPIETQEKEQLTALGVYEFSEHIHSFTETATIIENLDVVVSIDSAVAHLAGAMGKTTFNLLPFATDWRWQGSGCLALNGGSPLYPTMTLYQQSVREQWGDVLQKVSRDLQGLSDEQLKLV